MESLGHAKGNVPPEPHKSNSDCTLRNHEKCKKEGLNVLTVMGLAGIHTLAPDMARSGKLVKQQPALLS